ncbi:MAG: hypothetical protein Q8M40_09700 [Legionella sp.]|nr:hypothetical protein [Legionella sp.]
MNSLKTLVCEHPFFSMLVFTCIGFLIRGMRRIDLKAIRSNINELEQALKDSDIERSQYLLEQLKSGFGFK